MRFDELWGDAITTARTRLTDKGSDAAPLVEKLIEPSFPGMLALLSGPRRDGQRGGADFLSEVAAAAAGVPELESAGVDASAIRAILAAIFVERKLPSTTGKSSEALRAVLVHVLKKEGVAVEVDEAQEVIELLQSGRFYGDIESSLLAIFETLPRMPAALLKDVPRLPRLPLSALASIGRDLLDLLRRLPADRRRSP